MLKKLNNMRFFKQIWRGAGYLEGYGHHPGWSTISIIVLVGGLSGIEKGGYIGFIGGAGFSLICILPFFAAGCISRANGCDRAQANLLKTIKNS